MEKGAITKEESDKDGRAYTVLLQAIIENVLLFEQKNNRLEFGSPKQVVISSYNHK